MLKWLKKIFRKKKPIIIIAAIHEDRGIGYQGKLMHNIPADMKHFRDTTMGHTVIMGRKNWETIPEKYRPLPGRQNIVITRDTDYQAPGATVVHSLEDAFTASDRDTIYVIGGGQIYSLALPYAGILDLTLIHGNQRADAFFPEYDSQFQIVSGSGVINDPENEHNYEFQILKRNEV